MSVLGHLNLDAGVLTKRNAQGQNHRANQVIRVHESLARPLGDEELPKQHEAAVDPAEKEHLVTAHAGHKARQLAVIVRGGHDFVDLGYEDVRRDRGQRDEDVPNLDGNGKDRYGNGARQGAEQDVRHALVDEVADLVDENPRGESGDGTKQGAIKAPEVEAHPKLQDREARVEQEQRRVDGKLRKRDAHGAHAKVQENESDNGGRERGEHLPCLLKREMLVCQDIGVEDRREQRAGNGEGHDGHELAREPNLIGRETTREKALDVAGEEQAQRKSDRAHADVQHKVHAVEAPDILLGAVRPLQRVETDVSPGEAERQQREREHERVRRLENAVVGLPHERQQHRRVDKVDEVLYNDVRIAQDRPGPALANHPGIPPNKS